MPTAAVPEQRQLVTVRQRRFVVAEVLPSSQSPSPLANNAPRPQYLLTLNAVDTDEPDVADLGKVRGFGQRLRKTPLEFAAWLLALGASSLDLERSPFWIAAHSLSDHAPAQNGLSPTLIGRLALAKKAYLFSVLSLESASLHLHDIWQLKVAFVSSIIGHSRAKLLIFLLPNQ